MSADAELLDWLYRTGRAEPADRILICHSTSPADLPDGTLITTRVDNTSRPEATP